MRFWALGFALFLGFSSTVMAEARYVMDTIYVTIRAGMGDENKILKTIKSGTKLEVLEENQEEGWVRVVTVDGIEGWIRDRYLVNEPIAADRLEVAERELQQVTKERDTLKTSINEMKDKVKEAEKERKRLDSENQKLEKRNEEISQMAAKPLEMSKQNEELTAANASMRTELETLRQKVIELEDTGDLEWFISGGIIVVVGIIIGLVLPNLRGRKSSWA